MNEKDRLRFLKTKIEYLKQYVYTLCLPLIGISSSEIFNMQDQEIIKTEDYYFNAVKSGNYFHCVKTLVKNDKKEIIYKKKLHQQHFCVSLEFANELTANQYTLLSFLLIAFFKKTPYSTQSFFGSDLRTSINSMAIQKALISYLIGDDSMKNIKINQLLSLLDKWSNKTYEGKHVCFGFLVDCDLKQNKPNFEIGDFYDFINDEYSSTFTDGVTSVAKIDIEGNFIEYLSTTSLDNSASFILGEQGAPIRFAQIIINHVKENTIGIFLLTNGDVLIAKNMEIKFIKREGKWHNFSKSIFNSILKRYCDDRDLIIAEYLFGTILDISLSHSGGLIAIVDENNEDWKKELKNESKPLVSMLDLLLDEDFNNIDGHIMDTFNMELKKSESFDEFDKENAIKDIKKRLIKKKYLMELIKGQRFFTQMDRRLRSELSGLDGALILNKQGKIIACGAIIANKAGSTGGGRGSAAKTLSNYGGFAVKISTDGYVEIYKNEIKIYSIK